MKSSDLPVRDFDLHQGDELIMRLGVGLTLYYPRPFASVRENLWHLWQRYSEVVDVKRFSWARLGGGNRSRRMSPAVLKTVQDWLTGARDCGETCWISLHDGPFDGIGSNSFMLTGYGPKKNKFDEEAGFVDVMFPVDVLDAWGPSRVAETMIAVASEVPYFAGVGGFAFHRSPYKFNATIERMGSLSKRFRGVEIAASERLAYLAERGVPSVNWLTFVGESHLERLGGEAKLATDLESVSEVRRLAHGVVVKTGESPTLGDANRGNQDLDRIVKAYQVLSRVQFVDPVYAFHDLRFDGEQTVAWLTRFAR